MTNEALMPRAHVPQQEKPLQWEARSLQWRAALHLPQLEKKTQSNEDSAQPMK